MSLESCAKSSKNFKGGRGVYLRILDLPLGSRAGNFTKFQSLYRGGEIGLFDMFHVFAETSLLWKFSHLPLFLNLRPPPP